MNADQQKAIKNYFGSNKSLIQNCWKTSLLSTDINAYCQMLYNILITLKYTLLESCPRSQTIKWLSTTDTAFSPSVGWKSVTLMSWPYGSVLKVHSNFNCGFTGSSRIDNSFSSNGIDHKDEHIRQNPSSETDK